MYPAVDRAPKGSSEAIIGRVPIDVYVPLETEREAIMCAAGARDPAAFRTAADAYLDRVGKQFAYDVLPVGHAAYAERLSLIELESICRGVDEAHQPVPTDQLGYAQMLFRLNYGDRVRRP